MSERVIKVDVEEVEAVLSWADQNCKDGSTEHEDGTYEEGVSDGIRWLLGAISSRPDKP